MLRASLLFNMVSYCCRSTRAMPVGRQTHEYSVCATVTTNCCTYDTYDGRERNEQAQVISYVRHNIYVRRATSLFYGPVVGHARQVCRYVHTPTTTRMGLDLWTWTYGPVPTNSALVPSYTLMYTAYAYIIAFTLQWCHYRNSAPCKRTAVRASFGCTKYTYCDGLEPLPK